MKIQHLKIKKEVFDHGRTRIGHWINNRVSICPNRKKKIIVILFSVLGFGVATQVIVQAFQVRSGIVFPRINRTLLPVPPPSYSDYHLERCLLLHTKIQQIKKRLDSLSIHDSCRYQAILKANPELLKNIQSIESLFAQLKK